MAAGAIHFINDYSMATARERWLAKDYPAHHLWGMNIVEGQGWTVQFSGAPVRNRLPWPRLRALTPNIRAGIELALLPPRQPNIYFGSIHIYKLPGLLKSMGLLRRNLIVMVHHPVKASAVNRRALRAADAIFFLNRFAHDRTVAAMPELAARSHVPGWCVDLDYYDSQMEARPPAPKLIVAAGKELRDYETLVRAVATIEDPDLRVEIYCSEQTAPISSDPRVTVLKGGSHGSSISYNDLLLRYQDAIAIAIPMLPADRTVGMTSVFDAFAARRALMVTRHPCLDAPIEAEGLGLVMEPHSVDGWAAAIRQILADPAAAIDMGERGRRYAEAHLSIPGYGKRLDELFRSHWDHG